MIDNNLETYWHKVTHRDMPPIPCSRCGFLNKTIDLVCQRDQCDEYLVKWPPELDKGFFHQVYVNGLRAAAFAVAYSIGLFHLTWPAFALTFFLTFLFVTLLLRNHLPARDGVLVLGTIVFVLAGLFAFSQFFTVAIPITATQWLFVIVPVVMLLQYVHAALIQGAPDNFLPLLPTFEIIPTPFKVDQTSPQDWLLPTLKITSTLIGLLVGLSALSFLLRWQDAVEVVRYVGLGQQLVLGSLISGLIVGGVISGRTMDLGELIATNIPHERIGNVDLPPVRRPSGLYRGPKAMRSAMRSLDRAMYLMARSFRALANGFVNSVVSLENAVLDAFFNLINWVMTLARRFARRLFYVFHQIASLAVTGALGAGILLLLWARHFAIPFLLLIAGSQAATALANNLQSYIWSSDLGPLLRMVPLVICLVLSIIGIVASVTGVSVVRTAQAVLTGLFGPSPEILVLFILMSVSLSISARVIQPNPYRIGPVTILACAIAIGGYAFYIIESKHAHADAPVESNDPSPHAGTGTPVAIEGVLAAAVVVTLLIGLLATEPLASMVIHQVAAVRQQAAAAIAGEAAGLENQLNGMPPLVGQQAIAVKQTVSSSVVPLPPLQIQAATPLSPTSSSVRESFKNPTAPGWTLGGSARLTSGNADSAGDGWLRLTDNMSGLGYAYYDTAFPSSESIIVSFDYASWGGSGADGSSFFLFDGATTNFTPGAGGGALGYAPGPGACGGPTQSGLSGAYVGLGLDEYGDFDNNCGKKGSAVVLRGPGDGTTGYSVLTAVPVEQPLAFPNLSKRPSQSGSVYRHLVVSISPGAELSVEIQFGAGSSPTSVIKGYALPNSIPATLRFGFAASDGGLTDYHEIRNVEVVYSSRVVTQVATVTPSASTAFSGGEPLMNATAVPARANASGVTTPIPSSTFLPDFSGVRPTPMQVGATPTPVRKAGMVLYRADWTMQPGGWTPTFGWKPLNGMLQNDGSNAEGPEWKSNWLAAPFDPSGVRNYAVVVEVQLVRQPSCGSFGIVARDGYEAGIHICGSPVVSLREKSANPIIEEKSYSPDFSWHTLRIDLIGNQITVSLDGAIFIRATDSMYLSPGRLGLWSDRTQVSVRSLQVIALQ